MAKMDSTLRKLLAMKRAELWAIANQYQDPPIKLRKHYTGKQIAHKIRDRQLSDEMRSQKTSLEKSPGEQPRNLEFEKAVKMPAEPAESGHGGKREGAGRPPGLTAEKAKVKNLPQYPSIPIRQGVAALFDLWASATKIEQLALDDDETDLLALPVTQLQEYYFPNLIPEIAGSWVMLIFAATRVIKPRLILIQAIQQAKKEGRDVTEILESINKNGKTGHKNRDRQDGIRQDGESPKADKTV